MLPFLKCNIFLPSFPKKKKEEMGEKMIRRKEGREETTKTTSPGV